MLKFFSRLFRRAPAAPEPGSLVEELWLAELSGDQEGRFLEVEDSGYSARYLPGSPKGEGSQDGSELAQPRLALELRRPNLFAWTEAPVYRYSDFVLEGEISAPAREPYSASGFLFRYQDEGDFYALLVSNRGFFRLDVVLSGKPRTLVAWTELPEDIRSEGSAGDGGRGTLRFDLRVIARGELLTIMVDDQWVAEAADDSFDSGYVAFAAQRYAAEDGMAPDQARPDPGSDPQASGEAPRPAAFELRSCMVESRPVEVESWYYRNNFYVLPEASARRRLADTFFAMGESLSAAVQLRKLAKLRPLDPDELFLKAEAALHLGLRDEAEAALDACLAAAPDRVDAAEEKANLLYLQGRYLELRDALGGLLAGHRDNSRLLCLSGHAKFNLGDFAGAAEEYRAAADLEAEGSAGAALNRMNEARAWDQAGRGDEAAEAFLKAARLLAEQEADADLDLALGRLAALRPRSLEVKAIKAKALYRRGRKDEAAKLLGELTAKKAADSGSLYTLGLILAERGEGEKALEFFRSALELEPDFALYAFRYAERLFLLEQSGKRPRKTAEPAGDEAAGAPGDVAAAPAEGTVAPVAAGSRAAAAPASAREAVRRALALVDSAGKERAWILNLAGQEALSRGDLEAARIHLEAARAALPEAPEIAINVADLESRSGCVDRALAVLEPFADRADCRNQAGNVYAAAAGAFERGAIPGGGARAAEGADAPGSDPGEKLDELLNAAAREYLKATNLEPYAAEYQTNLAAAYIELERYADAEERLRKALDQGGGPRALLLTGNLARVYGDFPRAEAAYRLGLQASPEDPDLLLALGATYVSLRNFSKAEEVVGRLASSAPDKADRLRGEILEATTEPLSCSSCGRAWRVPRDLPAQSAANIRAMPPDDSPAGACPSCGKIFCIACRKADLSEDKRFTCPDCGEPLKLSDPRLRYLVRESLKGKNSG